MSPDWSTSSRFRRTSIFTSTLEKGICPFRSYTYNIKNDLYFHFFQMQYALDKQFAARPTE
jgi:hypothetical protein